MKVVIDNNVGSYVEYIKSRKGNLIWHVDEYICSLESLCEHERLTERNFYKKKYYIDDTFEDVYKVLRAINIEEFFARNYRESDTLDGYGWDIFVHINDKEYKTTGYENDPYEMRIIVNLLKDVLLKADPTIKFSSLQFIEV